MMNTRRLRLCACMLTGLWLLPGGAPQARGADSAPSAQHLQQLREGIGSAYERVARVLVGMGDSRSAAALRELAQLIDRTGLWHPSTAQLLTTADVNQLLTFANGKSRPIVVVVALGNLGDAIRYNKLPAEMREGVLQQDLAAMSDPSSTVRAAAVTLGERLHDPRSKERIENLFQEDADATVRKFARVSLDRWDVPPTLKAR